VVAQGHLDEDDRYYKGMVGDLYVARAPIALDDKVIRRGQDRFNIYCTPCHDRTGGGQGLAGKRGHPQPVSPVCDRRPHLPDGQVFQTITHGVRNMPAYRKQVPVEDRWAIVAWVRVLSRAANAKLEDVPADLQSRIEPEEVQ